MARAALRSDMYAVLAAVTRSVLNSSGTSVQAKIAEWRSQQAAGIARVQELLAEISRREQPDIAAISVALRTLRELVNQTQSQQKN